MLPEKVISKKEKRSPIKLLDINLTESKRLVEGNTALYIYFAIIKRAPRLEQKALIGCSLATPEVDSY